MHSDGRYDTNSPGVCQFCDAVMQLRIFPSGRRGALRTIANIARFCKWPSRPTWSPLLHRRTDYRIPDAGLLWPSRHWRSRWGHTLCLKGAWHTIPRQRSVIGCLELVWLDPPAAELWKSLHRCSRETAFRVGYVLGYTARRAAAAGSTTRRGADSGMTAPRRRQGGQARIGISGALQGPLAFRLTLYYTMGVSPPVSRTQFCVN